jgi:hypothetical protein
MHGFGEINKPRRMTVVDMVDYKLRSQVATKGMASVEFPIKEEDESS